MNKKIIVALLLSVVVFNCSFATKKYINPKQKLMDKVQKCDDLCENGKSIQGTEEQKRIAEKICCPDFMYGLGKGLKLWAAVHAGLEDIAINELEECSFRVKRKCRKREELLKTSAKRGLKKLVKAMLSSSEYRERLDNGAVLWSTIEIGFKNTAVKMLKNRFFRYTIRDNFDLDEILFCAVEKEFLNVVKLLLEHFDYSKEQLEESLGKTSNEEIKKTISNYIDIIDLAFEMGEFKFQ